MTSHTGTSHPQTTPSMTSPTTASHAIASDPPAAPSADQIIAATNAQRDLATQLFESLRRGSTDAPGITRDTYGAGENFAHGLVRDHALRLGLDIATDAAANTYITLPGRDRTAPHILTGSHLDSVPHGGNFDGAAGVVAGLVAVAALRAVGVTPACDITVMGVRAEESVWFEVSYLGSRSALGTLPPGALDARRIDTGRTLADHLEACGGDPALLRAGHRHLDPRALRAFLEVHIEQAPSLVEAGLPLAICTAIPGNFRYPNAWIAGEYAHVGLPRRFRRDAVMAAAEFAAGMDRLWAAHEAEGRPMALTLGRFHTDPAKHGLTTVPGAFHFSLDVRAYDDAQLAELERGMGDIIADIERRRGVTFHMGPRASAVVGKMDASIRARLVEGARVLGIPAMTLGSPASHDAAAFAAAGVPTAMMFVRNQNGSHNPHEAMEMEDFMCAASLLAWWLAENTGA
ncbi:hydantoinase/carbamoylase family amidase [Xanthobacter sp. VNH20]|uniref:hydantoinase/carbamoylase family amidase n=1 Tax=Xanthobacter sp. VNH20 TaxID=3156616 RepID=UPI0032B310F5